MGVAKLTDQNTIVPESKYARVERERRYLLQDLPEGLTRVDPHLQITDNYISGTRLRIRKVRVTMRVQAASASLRGTDTRLFRIPGTSRGGEKFVPDYTISFEVTPRNLNLTR